MGYSLPSAFERESTLCTQLIYDIKTGVFLPEYITMQEFDCEDGTGCFKLCKFGLESLNGPERKEPYYSVEHVFSGDVYIETVGESVQFKRKERLLYRLNTDVYEPK